jgi:sulfatase maturation enzyme AslB (radical SAM superfamily)
MRKLMLSRFAKTKEMNGVTAVFHSLHPRPIFLNSEEWKKYLNGTNDKNLTKLLLSSKVLIKNKQDDEIEMDLVRSAYEINNKQVSTLYLVLTHQCNFRCKYCFEVNYDDEKGHGLLMNNDIAKKASIYL